MEDFDFLPIENKARLYSGIDGEEVFHKFVKDAGLEFVKVNNLDPHKYPNEHGIDVVARKKIHNFTFNTDIYQYYIFEVTNFKWSTHMGYQVMTEKLDNICMTAREYPNAKLYLICSYNHFDKRINQRIHNLGITVITMGRINKVWGKFLKEVYDHTFTFQNIDYHLKQLRMIIQLGIRSKAEDEYSKKVQRIKDQLGKPIVGWDRYSKTRFGLDYFNGKLYQDLIDQEQTKLSIKPLLNQLYKANTQLRKLGQIPDKIHELTKDNTNYNSVKYKLTNKLRDIKAKIDKILKQKNNTNPVYQKNATSKVSFCFRKSSMCGVTVDDKVTYFCSYKPFSTELNLQHVPSHLHKLISTYC